MIFISRSPHVVSVVRQADDHLLHSRRPWTLLMAVLLTLFLMNRPVFGLVLTDDTIRRSIERHVVSEAGLTPDQIDIKIKDGIAILSGSVNNLLQKSRVRQIAESIRGVRSVVDTVAVKPVIRENEVIARDVRDNLGQIPPDRGLDVSVSVDRGIVTLKGTADSWVLSRLAVFQAMSINGVSEVVNQIDVKTRPERDDTNIALDVKRRLAADLYVDDALVEVTVKDGRVTLDGIVGTMAEKRRAADNAWISGVTGVDDRHLLVDWQEKDRMRRTSPYIRQSDQTILQTVKEALLMDPRVNATTRMSRWQTAR
jgi:osmotically-inducible protein OsmY